MVENECEISRLKSLRRLLSVAREMLNIQVISVPLKPLYKLQVNRSLMTRIFGLPELPVYSTSGWNEKFFADHLRHKSTTVPNFVILASSTMLTEARRSAWWYNKHAVDISAPSKEKLLLRSPLRWSQSPIIHSGFTWGNKTSVDKTNVRWTWKTNVKVEKRLLLFIKRMSNLKYKCRLRKWMLIWIKRMSKLKNKCSKEWNEPQSWDNKCWIGKKKNVNLEKRMTNFKNECQTLKTSGIVEFW